MLLKLEKLIAKYGMKITGVIQAGAHEGEEIDLFINCGIEKQYLFEPCQDSFGRLLLRGGGERRMIKSGLSDIESIGVMNVTRVNRGQSSSLLKPKKHLDYYPEIVFDVSETVIITTLDRFDIVDCNLLVMDVQGYELNVLKGATETLKHIDYIITEVNLEEMYEGCALIQDLDNYLTDFERVETKLVRSKAWGDALYLRKTLL